MNVVMIIIKKWKGKISNKHMNIKVIEEKEIDSNFVIIISIIM